MTEKIGYDQETLVDIQLQEETLKYTKRRMLWQTHRPRLAPMIVALTKLGVEPSLGVDSIDIAFTGDKQKLLAVWKILRMLGYKPNSGPPQPGDNQWYSFFDSPQVKLRIWMSFTSSVCQRVKTGTKLVEVDVYETVCTESPDNLIGPGDAEPQLTQDDAGQNLLG